MKNTLLTLLLMFCIGTVGTAQASQTMVYHIPSTQETIRIVCNADGCAAIGVGEIDLATLDLLELLVEADIAIRIQ